MVTSTCHILGFVLLLKWSLFFALLQALAIVEQPKAGGPVVDLSSVAPPVPVKKTLMVVNQFVVNTVNFLNKFSAVCESKLAKVNQDLSRLETVLALLETKLNSIPWLEANVGYQLLSLFRHHRNVDLMSIIFIVHRPGSAPAPAVAASSSGGPPVVLPQLVFCICCVLPEFPYIACISRRRLVDHQSDHLWLVAAHQLQPVVLP
jgi:hypothetical protein